VLVLLLVIFVVLVFVHVVAKVGFMFNGVHYKETVNGQLLSLAEFEFGSIVRHDNKPAIVVLLEVWRQSSNEAINVVE